MSYLVTLPAFSGPLDLLLRLIEREELDITTIAMAQVADQYLTHVRSLDEPDPRALAEFVSMAARLLLIKSRALLPRPAIDGKAVASADPDAEALAQQLREYRRYKQVAAMLRAWQDEDRRTFLRLAPLPAELDLAPPPVNHSVAELIAALQRRLQLALPLDEATTISLGPRITVAQVVARVRERLAHHAWFSFDDLFGAVVSREDVIVTFWAILELLKRQAVVVEQHELFGTISIGRGAAALESAEIGEGETL
ncbi:MAG: segregation/condensation protein A [Chloroflexales bacterium]|nr:segregation/condensation protein A [Chloroflexales bacterium]